MSKDAFANPQPPSNYTVAKAVDNSIDNLSNEDFRKLLMTPSVGGGKTAMSSRALSTKGVELNSTKKKFADEANQRRKAKKLHYAGLMKEVKEREAELADKYRDRAKERRETDKTTGAPVVESNTSANYQSVAPDFSLNYNVDRRMKIIEESKYLGGDLEHTHLVKGLDYALLQKVKAEIVKKDEELDNEEDIDEEERLADDSMEAEMENKPNQLKSKLTTKSNTAAIAAAYTRTMQDIPEDKSVKEVQKTLASLKPKKAVIEKTESSSTATEIEDDSKVAFKTKLGRSVYRVLFEEEPKKINELFQPHRMAYIVDLTNEEDVDVPITSIRSKADCPNSESNTSITTNDIVINKLTQILSYLRHGKRDAKKSRKKMTQANASKFQDEDNKKSAEAELSIYDDIGDYVATGGTNKDSGKGGRSADSKKTSGRDYFRSKDDGEINSNQEGPSNEQANEFIKNLVKGANKQSSTLLKSDEKSKTTGISVKFDQDSYSECYPGTRAEEDVNVDSDEEADFSKMDLGSKKGPVNRWDFETEGEYTSYMENREAMPKAAFQFGVKMEDGRKTRNKPGDTKNEATQKKNKLDKEWNQISKIIDKRKSGDFGSIAGKKPKY